jgi:energy-coupling factor transport system ATP-binding protein
MESIIRTEKLSYIYSDKDTAMAHVALDGVDLSFKRGSFTAVLGRNGSGKSTLAKHFNAILLPTGGRCYVKGIDTTDQNRLFEIRQSAGMVFQNPDNQIIAAVVEEDIAFAPENLGLPREEIIRRVEEALKAVGMYEFRNHAPHLLSGGQKQRVAIAGIMAMRPECVILDEPTAMLDPNGREEVLNTILALQAEYKLTLILITHHMSEAARADRVVVLDRGRVYMDGTPKSVFKEIQKLKTVGLDAPAAVVMLDKLNARGANIPIDAFDEKTCAERIYNWLHGREHSNG